MIYLRSAFYIAGGVVRHVTYPVLDRILPHVATDRRRLRDWLTRWGSGHPDHRGLLGRGRHGRHREPLRALSPPAPDTADAPDAPFFPRPSSLKSGRFALFG